MPVFGLLVALGLKLTWLVMVAMRLALMPLAWAGQQAVLPLTRLAMVLAMVLSFELVMELPELLLTLLVPIELSTLPPLVELLLLEGQLGQSICVHVSTGSVVW